MTRKNRRNNKLTSTKALNEDFIGFDWNIQDQNKYICTSEDPFEESHFTNVYKNSIEQQIDETENKFTHLWKKISHGKDSTNKSIPLSDSTASVTDSEKTLDDPFTKTIQFSTKNEWINFFLLKGKLSSASTLSLTADEDAIETEKYSQLNSVAERSEDDNIAHCTTVKKKNQKRDVDYSSVEEMSPIVKPSDNTVFKFNSYYGNFNAPSMTDDELIVVESTLRVQLAMTKYVLVAQLTSAVGQGILTSGVAAAWSVPSIMLSAHHRKVCKRNHAQCLEEITSRGLELAPIKEKSYAKRAFIIALGAGFVCCILPIALDMIFDGAVVELVSNYFCDRVLSGLEGVIQSKAALLTGAHLVTASESHKNKANDCAIAKLKWYSRSSGLFHRNKRTDKHANDEHNDGENLDTCHHEAESLFGYPAENLDRSSLGDSSSEEDDIEIRGSTTSICNLSVSNSTDNGGKISRWGKKIITHFKNQNLNIQVDSEDSIPKYYTISREERLAWHREAEGLFGDYNNNDIISQDICESSCSDSESSSGSSSESDTDAFSLFGIKSDIIEFTASNTRKMKRKSSRKAVDTVPMYSKEDEDELNRVVFASLRDTYIQSNDSEYEEKINEVIRTTMLQAAHDSRIRDNKTPFSVSDARDFVGIVTLTLEYCTN